MEAARNVLVAGYKLDRYELLCPIASGGMATVWLARLRGKRGFEKLFAIKTIRTELLEDAHFQEMFLDEARIASSIQHPNVAQILDLGEQREVLFIVMEWVDGDALAKIRKLLARRGVKLPVGIALRILADACAGLHAAHELRDPRGESLGIVHRDVSPHNILVASSGAVKVIDFGIAKAQNRTQGETRTVVVKGKIQYMAPEQVKKGRAMDRRADIWSLGICLHELVAGKTPTETDDDVEIIRRLLSDEAPPIAEGLPAPVVRILEESMVMDPDARFPTASAMRRALDAAMKELGETAETEDVAAFLRSELPELADRRRGVVTEAIEGARERGTPAGGSREEVAFAPTMVGDRSPQAPDEARSIALTRRKEGTSGAASLPEMQVEVSRVRPSSPADEEPLRIPKRSRAGVWLFLLLAAGLAGSAYRWPGVARRFLGTRAQTNEPLHDAKPPAAAEGVHAAPVSPGAAVTSTSATPAAVQANVAASAAPAPASGRHATPELHAHAPAHGATPPVASGAPVAPAAAASASATPASASGSAAALPPPGAPPATPEDPGNPYNN